MRPSAITVPSIFTLLARSSDPQPPKRSPPISPVRAYTRKQRGRCKMINTPNTGCPVLGVFTTRIFRFVAFSGPFSAYKNRKTHDLHRIFNGQSWVFFGALEGTRIPGPLIKSQMLYRLSYERIFSVLHILPNNNTTTAPKKQEGSAKKWPVHRPQRNRPLSFMKKTPGQPCALAATPSLQMGRKPVQSKQNAPPRPVCGGAF